MNFYLSRLIIEGISVLIINLLSVFNLNGILNSYEIISSNNISIFTEKIEYNTIQTYKDSQPSNITKVLQEGKEGLVFKTILGDEIVLEEPINEIVQLGTGKNGNYEGIITGYGPDCKTCDGKGYVACNTKDKKSFNLIKDGIYYEDSEFGSVRVLAAALKEFPCGTIVEVDSKTLGKFTGIVLDTGYDMRRYYELGIYHFDVAFETEKDKMVAKTTDMSGNVKYNIQRWGW